MTWTRVRWLGIRHGLDHVHVVATLVRRDGRTVFAWNDYRHAQALARELEIRYGLHRVAGRSQHRGVDGEECVGDIATVAVWCRDRCTAGRLRGRLRHRGPR